MRFEVGHCRRGSVLTRLPVLRDGVAPPCRVGIEQSEVVKVHQDAAVGQTSDVLAQVGGWGQRVGHIQRGWHVVLGSSPVEGGEHLVRTARPGLHLPGLDEQRTRVTARGMAGILQGRLHLGVEGASR